MRTIWFALFAFFVMLSTVVHAQERADAAVVAADPLGALVTVIKDEKLRGELIAEIERTRADQAPTDTAPQKSATDAEPSAPDNVVGGTGLAKAVVEWVRDLGHRLPSAALGAPIDVKFQQAHNQIEQRLSAPQATQDLTGFGLRSVPGWVIGTIAALLAVTFIRRRTRARIAKAATVGQVAKIALIRMAFGLVPLVVCLAIAAAWANLLGFSERGAMLFFVLTMPFAVVIAVSEIVSSLLLFLAPAKGWRMISYSQRTLAPIIGMMSGVATLGSLMALPELRASIGPATADIFALLFDLAVPLIALYIVFRHRRTVRTLIVRGHAPEDDAPPFDRAIHWVGEHWHHLGILFVVLNIGARLFGAQAGSFLTQSFLSVALIVLALIASATLRRFAQSRESNARNRHYQVGVRTMIFARLGSTLFRVAKVAIALFAVVACLELWGVNIFSWMNSGIGAQVVGSLFSIFAVVLVTWTIWVVLDAWISNALSPADSRNHRERSARAKTLLPLLRNVAFVALTVMTVIGVLSNLGINVAPLIAGAGVVGLAVGFGSQQLVQDVITGLFILLEDTLAIGDSIDTGDRAGTVEALTIRTVKIRDGDGALHSIPFSMIKALKNSSRGFGVYTASVTLDVDADVERAIDVFKEVGEDIRQDPKFAGKIVAPLDVWGVDQVGLDGLVIKASIKTLPLQQYGVGREINRRMRDSLQNAGVKLATRGAMPIGVAA